MSWSNTSQQLCKLSYFQVFFFRNNLIFRPKKSLIYCCHKKCDFTWTVIKKKLFYVKFRQLPDWQISKQFDDFYIINFHILLQNPGRNSKTLQFSLCNPPSIYFEVNILKVNCKVGDRICEHFSVTFWFIVLTCQELV